MGIIRRLSFTVGGGGSFRYPEVRVASPDRLPQNRFSICRMQTSKLGMEVNSESNPATVKLKPIDATPESFKEFGQVMEASQDGDEFGPKDAQLDLTQGTPRFYIMHLENRPLRFSTITHHASVTQCLGAIGAHTWYLGVAKPSIVDNDDGNTQENLVRSHCGHLYLPLAIDHVHVFRITGPKFVKLHRGTWHAGPLFNAATMDFYNLELSNTNVLDHTTHNFKKQNGVIFLIDED